MRLVPKVSRASSALSGLCLTLLVGCHRSEELLSEAPPSVQSPSPGICARLATDVPLTPGFVRETAGYCLDPNAEIASYGAGASRSLGDLCLELLDGECDVYKGYGLERAFAGRYVDGGGSPAAVSVLLTSYASTEGAFGFYTRRVVAGSDPAHSASAPFEVAGVGALGSGIATVYRGTFVLELSYGNELEPPDQLRASAATLLPPLARAMSHELAAPTELPRAARALPSEARVPSGIGFDLTDLLGVKGTGAGAFGYYARDGKRWRVMIFARSDEESIKDLVGTFRKARGHRAWKDALPALDSAFRYVATLDGITTQWVFAQKGPLLIGVGDEPLVLTPSMSNAVRETLALSDEAKQRELLALSRAALPR